MRIVAVIPSRQWRNARTGATASLYGACPWTCDAEKADWSLVTVGWTWELSNGTIGLGRVPAKTREEAEEIMARYNARFAPRGAS